MARPSMENERQIVEWINEGRPYREIIKLYEMAYHRRLSMSTINNVRKRNGLPARIHRDRNLMPWQVSKEHANQKDAVGLRAEGRLRAGLPVNEETMALWRRWRNDLSESGLVVDYDPVQGWSWVKPRPGVDVDLVRTPSRVETRASY